MNNTQHSLNNSFQAFPKKLNKNSEHKTEKGKALSMRRVDKRKMLWEEV